MVARKWEEETWIIVIWVVSRPRSHHIRLGTMMFGGPTDEPTSGRIIGRAREAGINFIDTADAYNNGRSEEVVGRAIAAERSWWILATKLANPTGESPNDLAIVTPPRLPGSRSQSSSAWHRRR